MKAVIALGSNLGDRHQTLTAAVNELAAFITNLQVSTFIESAPVGGITQPDYLNAVAIGESELSPLALLHALQNIENAHHRTREVRWGARTLDLDLIVYGAEVMETEELTLPHPRAHERAFVLAPWLEIDPDGELPGFGAIAKLLNGSKI